MRWFAVLLSLSMSCSSVTRDGATPVEGFLDAPDQTLPTAIVGTPYDAFVTATGGTPPLDWAVDAPNGLPGGLTFQTDGQLIGTPTEAGQHVIDVVVSDDVGRESSAVVVLPVELEATEITCGETLDVTLTGQSLFETGSLLDDLDALRWIAVRLPDDLTTRVELELEGQAGDTLYVQDPDLTHGSWDLTRYQAFPIGASFRRVTAVVDERTEPSLPNYASQGFLPLLVLARNTGTLSLEVVCSDGPILTTLQPLPTEIGREIDVDFDVFGDNEGVRIWTDDSLPDWIVWDESTGEVSGIAEASITTEFDIQVQTPDGRYRQERAILGVYDVERLACGETTESERDEGYFQGDFQTFFDPKGFSVQRLEFGDPPPSSITFDTQSNRQHFYGSATPGATTLKFFPGAIQEFSTFTDSQIELSPTSFPSILNYIDSGEFFLITANIPLGGSTFDVDVNCDSSLRHAFSSLPVALPFESVDGELEGIGGAPPYSWSASGLPPGIALSADGRLSGTTGGIGTYEVTVTATDRLGDVVTEPYPFYVGLDEACGSATPLRCGEALSLDGAGTTTFCSLTSQGSMGWSFESDDASLNVFLFTPGSTRDDVASLDLDRLEFVTSVTPATIQAVALNPSSLPGLDDFSGSAVFVLADVITGGDWSLQLTCDDS